MKLFAALLILFSSSILSAESDEYWELYETYASADAAKYHDILQSIESGDIEEAKEKLLTYQAAEILVLEEMKSQRKLREGSENLINLVRQYNKLHVN